MFSSVLGQSAYSWGAPEAGIHLLGGCYSRTAVCKSWGWEWNAGELRGEMTSVTGVGFGSFCFSLGTKNAWEMMRKHLASYLMCSAVRPGKNFREQAPSRDPVCILSHLALLYLRISLIHLDRRSQALPTIFHCPENPGTGISLMRPVACVLSSEFWQCFFTARKSNPAFWAFWSLVFPKGFCSTPESKFF